MTEEAKADASVKEAKHPPSSLSAFIRGSASAGRYVAAIGKEAKIPDEAERAAAFEIVASDPKLLAKVVELMRVLLDPSHSRARGAIRPWASEVLRARDPDLERWGLLADRSPDHEVADLARRLRRARTEGDKDRIFEAEQMLLLGIAITSTRAEFDVIGTLFSIHSALYREDSESDTNRRAERAVATASLKQLRTYGAINQLVSARLQKLDDQYAAVQRDRDLARERIHDLQDKIARLSAESETLRKEKQQAAQEADALRRQLEGTKGGAAHDMIEARARFRRLLTGKLSPFVNDASLALDVSPPVVNIAKERLGQIRSEIDKELEWLKQFSD